jgi:RNA polymerase sigma factor (sigma-70 family)
MPQDAGFPVEERMPLIRHLSRVRARTYGLDPDDLRQELVLVLLEKPFDAARFTPDVWIHLQVREAVRRLAGPRRRSRERYGLVARSGDGNRRGGPKRGEDDDMPAILPLIEVAPDRRANQEDAVDDRDELEFVLAQVNTLPPESAEVIRLRFFDGLTFEAIGDALGIGRTAARDRYLDALEQARRLLGITPHISEDV